jgi:hypothetical protein
VNFRVSDEEYETLRIACAQHGARSISDFARHSVLGRSGENPVQAAAIERQLSVLGRKVAQLEGRMSDLLGRLETRPEEPDPAIEEPSGIRR